MSDRRTTPPREAPRKRTAKPRQGAEGAGGPARPGGGGWLAAILGFGAASLVGGAIVWASGCDDDQDTVEERQRATTPAGASTSSDGARPEGSAAKDEDDDASPSPSGSASAAAAAPAPIDPERWEGPWLGATAFQTPIYPEPRFSDQRLGYLRQGAKVPVDPKPLKRPNCKQGWYKLVQGGYVCGKYATTDVEQPRVKLGVKAPDLDAILPYKYAYNRFHGTPLYKKPPTREEMEKYEPHIAEERAKKAKKAAEKEAEKTREREKREAAAEAAKSPPPSAEASPSPSGSGSGSEEERRGRKAKREPATEVEPRGEDGRPAAEGSAVPTGDDAAAAMAAVAELEPSAPEEGEPPPEKPWWQIANETGDKPKVTLADMTRDSGGSLEKRMAKGFFVAVDKNVGWNGRSFFRTTNGLLAPSDRMWLNKPPESKGLEVPEGAKSVFFVLSDKARLWEIDESAKKAKDVGPAARFSGHGLTGDVVTIAGTEYRRTLGKGWLKSASGTWTEPGKRPDGVAENEKWVDVNLDRKTLLLFVGEVPVYAALVSPGKRSRDKKKDHATKVGAWRIREKHVAVTMDGDGAGGDLPYSIDDVPFVAYYDGSYALHGAFWHSNFGREMSHGCVNLAPHDAKYVFGWTEPRLPRGWHAAYATKERPGSMVSIH